MPLPVSLEFPLSLTDSIHTFSHDAVVSFTAANGQVATSAICLLISSADSRAACSPPTQELAEGPDGA
jgi:hypothetical protein